MSTDVRDILELEKAAPEITKESILGPQDAKKKKFSHVLTPRSSRRPEGMAREVFALLYNDNKDAPPLLPTDTGQGYKQTKAKLGMRKVRPWEWTPFTNPARTDGAVFHHWRRVADEGKEYPFAKFNKKVPIPTYTDAEYAQHLQSDWWTKAETDHLFSLCRQFDLRFIVIQDRYDEKKFQKRSVEDLKERYYSICSILHKVRKLPGAEPKAFDADHEKRRKEQLARLYNRTPEQVEEEMTLMTEYRKIEARKRERDKKTQDLQKLITAADNQSDGTKSEKKTVARKKFTQVRPKIDTSVIETAGIKFPDCKSSGVSVRSQRMKLPASVGQKKMKAIEQMLQELGIEENPMPTEEICQHFNELRSDMVLLYELKMVLQTCEYELQSLRHQYESMSGDSKEPKPAASTQ
ncbi:unnamed protein product [Bemisia tabaci]|uniref:DNA methyltransferase 1-associated protein 1 n=1 Tax=Bemisia tabaci TaxID=7038 RepID=A0A9P0ANA3_BEMTA|nr:PREDICTED: DNA methyltransferase 1-associated protein 1 [Bemisia tabaci]CAH0395496.1 unnamed protein product [Bemisia tabaci]